MTCYTKRDLTECLEGLVREGLIPDNPDGIAKILTRLLETFNTTDRPRTDSVQCDHREKITVKLKSPSTIKHVKTGSEIAKSGFKEEFIIAERLNDTTSNWKKLLKISENNQTFSVLRNQSKVDITNGTSSIQCKKSSGNFSQIARCKVTRLSTSVGLSTGSTDMLKKLCEFPVLEKRVAKPEKRIALSAEFFTDDELKHLTLELEQKKTEIVHFALLGDDTTIPDTLVCSHYDKDRRDFVVAYKMVDIIEFLKNQTFEIRPSKTVIELGKLFTIQRKGGDSGKESSNDIQIKMICADLIKEIPHVILEW